MNQIHPTALVGSGVAMGSGNQILAYSVLDGPLTMGDDNVIGPHVVIGTPGQDTRDPRYDSSNAPIIIGSRNIIREFTAIQKPCYGEVTQLGSDIFLMQGVHIPHDAVIEDSVVVTPQCVVGGIARIMTCATLGMGSTVHQYSIVGPYSMVAMGAAVMKNVKPFSRYIPGKLISVNHYALEKFGWGDESAEIEAYVLEGHPPESGRLKSIVERYRHLAAESQRSEY